MNRPAAIREAGEDLRAGLRQAWMWHALAWVDIRRRFARSVLGPVWLTFNILLPTAALALIFEPALGQGGSSDYFAYVAFGLVLWQFIQAVVIEGCTMFVAAGEVIRNAPLPLTLHVARLVWRNVIVFVHNLIVVGVVLTLLGKLGWPHWSVIPALMLEVVMAGACAMAFGIANARYRDLAPLAGNALQLLFFLTPVFWYPGQLLAGRETFALANPAAAFIEIARAPLLGVPASQTAWLVALGCTIVMVAGATAGFVAARRRLVFWV